MKRYGIMTKINSESYLLLIYQSLSAMSTKILNDMPKNRIKRIGADGWLKIDAMYIPELNEETLLGEYIPFIKKSFSKEYGVLYSILMDYVVVLEQMTLEWDKIESVDEILFYNHTFIKLLDSVRRDRFCKYDGHEYNAYISKLWNSIKWQNGLLKLPPDVCDKLHDKLITIMKELNIIHKELSDRES